MVKARKTAQQIRIANLVLRCILPLIANNVSRVPDSYLGGRRPTWSVSAVRNCNIRSAIFVKTEPNRVRPPPRGSPKSHGSVQFVCVHTSLRYRTERTGPVWHGLFVVV